MLGAAAEVLGLETIDPEIHLAAGHGTREAFPKGQPLDFDTPRAVVR